MYDLDATRGVAIVLVVVGHIAADGSLPPGNDWYYLLMKMIYQFHMPLFMVLFGLTFALSIPEFHGWKDVRAYSIRRITPLIGPYLVLGLLVVSGKMVASHFLHVDNPPRAFVSSLVTVLFVPTQSAARFLWFIYVTSVYLLVVPPLFYKGGRRPLVLLGIGVAIQFVDVRWPEALAIQRAVEYLPFFAGGMVLWIYRSSWTHVASKLFLANACVFVVALICSCFYPVPRWFVGSSSVLPIIGLIQRMPSSIQGWWAYLGTRSLSIYLFNEIAMGLTKGVLFRALPWDGKNFFLYFPLLTFAGIAGPVAIKRATSQWFPRLARYV
jgi:fucose 4-O-acetylase-like acetyltransferase